MNTQTARKAPAFNPKMPAILLDIRGLILRSYHSGTDLHPVFDPESGARINSTSHGAANFMERVLVPILSRYAPINIVVVADGGSELRRMVYPGYKSNRQPQPPAEKIQTDALLEGVNRVLAYLGATIVKVDGREADDVIAAFCHAMPEQHKLVYTVDQDLLQLADDTTSVILFDEPREYMRDTADLSTGKQEIRIEPEFVALYKSLVGDSSDCYGGVKGFGKAKWLELVDAVGPDGLRILDRAVATNTQSLLNQLVIDHPDNKGLRIVHNAFYDWRTMYYLAKLHPESIWACQGSRFIKPEFTKRLPNKEKLFAALSMIGVDDYMEKFLRYMPTETLADASALDAVFAHMNQHLEDSPAVGFDYESVDDLQNEAFQEVVKKRGKVYVDVLSQKITGASVCYGDNLQYSAYFPVRHKDTKVIPLDYVTAVLSETQELKKPLVIHNSAFEITLTETNIGPKNIHRPHCTHVMASYYNENLGEIGGSGLKDLAFSELRYTQQTYSEVLEACGAANMAELTGEQVLHYGCDDSFVAGHLWVLMRWVLIIEAQWDFFLREHTAPAHLMSQAYRKGVNIDWDVLNRLAEADKQLIESGMASVRELLKTHCTEQKPDAVAAFLNSDREAIEHDLKTKWLKKSEQEWVGAERMEALWQERYLKTLEKSVYTSYTEVPRIYEFKGTAAQLRDVSAQLGFSAPIAKDSLKALGEWLVEHGQETASEQQEEFCALLASALNSSFKKREGPEFYALNAFCTSVMQPLMKSDWVGDELNFDSPNQVQELLYCKLGLPVRRRSKVQRGSSRHERGFEGSPATNKSAWNAALAEDCPPGDWRRDCLIAIREVKEATTRFELYYTPYPLWKHPEDDCIHPSIKDPGTVTRRPTSGDPNILQVSKGPVREMFIPHKQEHRTGVITNALMTGAGAPEIFIPKLPKRLIMAPDFSGQELRITGSEAKDPALIHAYTGGEVYTDQYGVVRRKMQDVHSLTTVMFLHKYLQRDFGPGILDFLPLLDTGRVAYDWYVKVRKTEDPQVLQELLAKPHPEPGPLLKAMIAARSKMAKPTNFLITYLGTAPTLAENTSMPEEFCAQVMEEVFSGYPRIRPWQAEVIEFARSHGYVTTAYGTRKHVDEEILSNDRAYRSRQERRAVNQTVQGCAADILHVVETDIWETDFLGRYDSHFLAPVYDELVLDVPLNDNLPELITELAGMMDITPPGHAIPMMAEFSFGPNWYKQHELGERPHARQIEEGLSKLFLSEVA